MRIVCKWILVFCILLHAACNSKSKNDKPVLSKTEMVPLVYGLMVTDEYTTQLKMRDTALVLKDIREKKYEQLFRLNKTDRESFASSYKYYLGHPDELKVIFDSVEATATRKRIELMVPSIKAPIRKAVNPK